VGAVTVPDLVGPMEIAERLKVQRGTVHTWRLRGVLPEPLAVISGVPIWDWEAIKVWAAERKRHGAYGPTGPTGFYQ
jgi:hypothetical protein